MGMRVDRAVSRALAAYFNSMSKGTKLKPTDFSPYDEQKAVNVEDPQEVFNVLKGLAHGK
jgi:hypothetical protein